MTIRGRAAHAGMAPEKGIGAIQGAADAIAGMRRGRIDDETTANLGVIRGGRATTRECEEVTSEVVAELWKLPMIAGIMIEMAKGKVLDATEPEAAAAEWMQSRQSGGQAPLPVSRRRKTEVPRDAT